eukprot:scaffold10143_cov120-Isochrysis_galbana.AAC.4
MTSARGSCQAWPKKPPEGDANISIRHGFHVMGSCRIDRTQPGKLRSRRPWLSDVRVEAGAIAIVLVGLYEEGEGDHAQHLHLKRIHLRQAGGDTGCVDSPLSPSSSGHVHSAHSSMRRSGNRSQGSGATRHCAQGGE